MIKVFDSFNLKNLFTASQTTPSNNTNRTATATSSNLSPIESPILGFQALQLLQILH